MFTAATNLVMDKFRCKHESFITNSIAKPSSGRKYGKFEGGTKYGYVQCTHTIHKVHSEDAKIGLFLGDLGAYSPGKY